MLRRCRFALLLISASMLSCAATEDESAVRATAERFYSASASGDGSGACGELAEATRMELEQAESAPCQRAIRRLALTGGTAVEASRATSPRPTSRRV